MLGWLASPATASFFNNHDDGGSGSGTDGSASTGGQVKAVSMVDAQTVLSSISAKIYGTSATAGTSSTNTQGVGGGGGNDGAGEVTGADLANLRAVAFGSEEGKKVSLGVCCVDELGGGSYF